jgi:hypothetical protein
MPIDINTTRAFSWMKQARQLWGSVDYSWQRWVINYTSENQSKFLSSLGINNFKSMAYSLVSTIGLITLVLAWFILKSTTTNVDKELLVYQLFCKKLAKAGVYKGKGETAQNFSRRIQKQFPELADVINNITSVFIKIRYQKELTEEDFVLLKKEVARFKL